MTMPDVLPKPRSVAPCCPARRMIPAACFEAAAIYGVTARQICGLQRRDRVVRARHWAMYNAYCRSRSTLSDIAVRMGQRDHLVVRYAIARHAVRHGLPILVKISPDHPALAHPYEGPEPTLERPWRAGGRA